jgi:DNA polymerase iota
MDVTDMVEYNLSNLNRHSLEQSFFQTSKDDPTQGFAFDATQVVGNTCPKDQQAKDPADMDELSLRLTLGSHLARHMRYQLEQQKGYTATVGIATSKLLCKLVGNVNKPKAQTTLVPPLEGEESNVQTFMDAHEIGKVPGIGFKLAQKLREFILQRPANFDAGLVYGGTKEQVTVADVRRHPAVNAEMLEKLLAGPGSPHGIGYKVWCLLHGVDDTEVGLAKAVPSQISIEDSYIRLDTMPEVLKELEALARSLLMRMRADLLGDEDEDAGGETTREPSSNGSSMSKKWLAHPKTLRLTTRPRQPLQPDGTRVRSFKRISHSAPLPTFVFSLTESVDAQAERLVREALVTLFRKLHPEKSGWNLSLVNLAVTNMAETAGESRTANGRDIGGMFRRQEDVLKDFKVRDESSGHEHMRMGSEGEEGEVWDAGADWETNGNGNGAQYMEDDSWEDEGEEGEDEERCDDCGMKMPSFAMIAHRRFHDHE